MLISGEMQERIRRQLTADPLSEGELRRIEGMGELYITLIESEFDLTHYEHLFNLKVGEVDHKVLSRITNGK